MKCPKCGADMAEGSLYCEQCGEEIHMVPDYEPELEFSIIQSMNNIMADVNGDSPAALLESSEDEKRIGEISNAHSRNSPGGGASRQDGRNKGGQAGKETDMLYNRDGQNCKNDQMYEQRVQNDKRDNSDATKNDFQENVAENLHRKKNRLLILSVVCAGVIMVICVAGGIMLYLYNSYDYQLEQAMECLASQRYDKAIQYYSRALELDDKDIEVRFSLADTYFQKGNKIEYEYLLREIIHNTNADDAQLERAYGKLIAVYREKKDYNTINQILMACDNEKIQNIYQTYIAKPPEFSYQEGYYTEIVPLKLIAATTGKIYYTLDGTQPDDSSMEYTAPIFLDNGDHMVKACFVNEYGVYSSCVSKEFHVSITQVAAPDISVISGEYYYPMLIEVLDYYDGEVYYTTDGSEPGQHSLPYTGAIPMPIGRSTFKFAFVMQDGSISDIAERTYQLRLNTLISEKDAERKIVDYMVSTGKIYDSEGNYSEENAGQYKYQYQCVLNVNQESDYYMIAEIYKDEDGNMTKTGSYFAVDIYSGGLFKLQVDENSNYTLVEILIDSPEG